MAHPLLYYPDFHPDPTWLRAVLLLNDNVSRIIPEGETRRTIHDPEWLVRLTDELGLFSDIPSSPPYIHFDPPTLAILERTLALISQERDRRGNRRVVHLYAAKVSPDVADLLQRYKLYYPDCDQLTDSLGRPTRAVELASATAVLSCIADEVARHTGILPTTYYEDSFSLTALGGQNFDLRAPAGASKGALAGTIASVLIPREVGTIGLNDYAILRASYEGIRIAYGKLIGQLHEASTMGIVTDTEGLLAKIEDCATDVKKEFDEFKKVSRRAKRLARDWWPIGVSGLCTLAKDYLPDDAGPALAALGVAVQIVKTAFPSTPDGAKEKLFSLAAELGEDIKALPRVKQIVHADASALGMRPA